MLTNGLTTGEPLFYVNLRIDFLFQKIWYFSNSQGVKSATIPKTVLFGIVKDINLVKWLYYLF